MLIVEIELQQLKPGVEEGHQDRQALGCLFLRTLAKVILPEVADQEFLLVTIGQPIRKVAGRVAAGATADHLLQLDAGLHWPHKDQVHRFGHVYPGLEHVYRDGNAGQALFLEVVDQRALVLRSVGDHLHQAGILRIHLLEHFCQAQGVILSHGKDNRLAGKLSRLVLVADLHDLFPLLAECVLVADPLFQVGARVVNVIGVESLLDQGVALFFG